MDIFTAIHSRRSVRRYTDEPVTREEVKTLLEAAMSAPSAGNSQPWRFVVLDDRAQLDKAATLNPYGGMAAQAPLAILVCADPSVEKHGGFWVQDCSAAVENMLLAAVGLGLGAVWTGLYPVEERVAAFKKLCALPGHFMPLGLVILGRPAVQPEPKNRYDELKVRYNSWT
jgi:nitroreductase